MLYDKGRVISWVLPVISMSLGGTAGYAMWMRRYYDGQLNQDYIHCGRAKGMSDKQIMVKHVLRNAFVPMAQYLPASVLFHLSPVQYI